MCLKSASGSGKSLAILQSLNRIVEIVDLDNSNYDVGNIGKGSSQQFPTTGALLVYLIGSGFGVYHLSPTSNFGLGKILSRAQPMQLNSYLESTSSASTLWRSDSSTFFLTAIGNGRGLWLGNGETNAQLLVLKIGQATTSASSMFTFASPRIVPTIQTKVSTGLSVYVIGQSFATWNNAPVVAFVAGSKSFMSNWMSDSSILAKIIASPFNGSTQIIVSVNSQIGTFLMPWNVNITLIPAAVTAPSTGSIISQLAGQSFGIHQNSAKSKLLQTVSQFTQWLSDSGVRIKLLPLKEQGIGVIFTVNRLTGMSDANLSGQVHSVQYLGSDVRIPTSGAVLLSLKLFSGGIFDHSFRCKLDATSRSSISASFWKSDSSIVTKLNAGMLKNFEITVSLNRFTASTASIMIVTWA
jgi:hypothetical protein